MRLQPLRDAGAMPRMRDTGAAGPGSILDASP
jgi:hypothetical protein